MFKTSDGVLIDYQVIGDSPEAIVFLNGVFMHYNSWLFAVENLKRDFKIVLHNFRCQWTSQNAPCSFDRHVEDLKELLKYLGIDNAHLVGTSYGGEVAMHFAIKYPAFVKTLVVITAAARINEALKYRAIRWKEGAKTKDPHKFVLSWIDDVYSDFFLDSHENLLENIAERMKNFNYDGAVMLLDSFLQMQKEPLLPKLHGIKAPTTIVSAQFDRTKPPYFSQEISNAIPNSRHIMIPNCGHAAVVEKPQEVLSVIKAAISG
ncbi:alpha/beta fold hydrolase [Pseudothermotoga thermarum]|uniref:Alpha/beta hydrolase fold protein n=1 Tax=Pseudothermotoga thermarum DSM 5069 TaxID=688269 RepID=F7YUC9_9THEM|nr:alpha/beta hydrolase [Pseudothermotoga thermarum]AEH51328.1 alpha/beta hydrolase fold protein [Pseudothermotoga thermarum DSM 5069]